MAKMIALHVAGLHTDAQVEALTTLISPEKRQKLRAFKQHMDVLRSLYGELLVRDTASKVLGISNDKLRIRTGAYGKPSLYDWPEFHFNISHSGHYIVMIYGEHPVGIDIEEHKKHTEADFLSMSRLCMTPAEQHTLRALGGKAQEQYFYDIWTLKESYVKAVGQGLSLPLESFEVRIRDEQALPGIRLHGTIAANEAPDAEFNNSRVYHLRTYTWVEPRYTLSACSAADDLPCTIVHREAHELDLVRNALRLGKLNR